MSERQGITPADIESKFREVQGQIDAVTSDGKRVATLVGWALAVVVLIMVYVLGRRAGRRRNTVVEIRRI